MAIWYSNLTNAFYDDTRPNIVIPSEAVMIDDDLYANVVNASTNGYVVTTDNNGLPLITNTSIYPPYRVITSFAFLARFQPEERGGIVVAALSALNASPPDPTISIFLDDLGAATVVSLDDPNLVGAIAALQQYGLLTSDRANAIMESGTFEESTDSLSQYQYQQQSSSS